MEIKSTCTQCAQPLAFPAEMAGQTIACPHCKFDTLLTDPRMPPKQASKSELIANASTKPKGNFLEDTLENIGDGFFKFGVVAAVICAIAAIPAFLGEEVIAAVAAGLSAAVAYAQGVLIRVVLYAMSKHLRYQAIIAAKITK